MKMLKKTTINPKGQAQDTQGTWHEQLQKIKPAVSLESASKGSSRYSLKTDTLDVIADYREGMPARLSSDPTCSIPPLEYYGTWTADHFRAALDLDQNTEPTPEAAVKAERLAITRWLKSDTSFNAVLQAAMDHGDLDDALNVLEAAEYLFFDFVERYSMPIRLKSFMKNFSLIAKKGLEQFFKERV